MASSHQESDSELEKKQDQFNRLPDDVVLLIINKLLHAKTLIRFSLVSKRFLSLVFQTDAVFVEFDHSEPSFVGRLFGFLRSFVTKVTRTSTPTIPISYTQKLHAIIQRFQQIKHLHVHLCFNFARESLEGDAFFRWVAAFGSHFEFFNLIFAESVNQSKPSVAAGITVTQGLNDRLSAHALKFLESSLQIASRGHDMIREHVLGLEMLESVVVSYDFGKVVMGKEQIARLRSSANEEVVSNVVGLGSYVPTLGLEELGYTMKDVMFVQAIAVNQDSEGNVAAVMGADQHVQEMGVSFQELDDSDFKQGQVFDEAVRLLMNEQMKTAFTV